MLAWHFTSDTLRDGRPIPRVGEWLVHEGEIVPCRSGLHASVEPWDALTYAPGPILHQVELKGELKGYSNDKWVGRKRKILKSKNITDLLRRFACDQALKMCPEDAPKVVKEYLRTCDEGLREAAREAAREASKEAEVRAAVAEEAAWETAVGASVAEEAAWESAVGAARWTVWETARWTASSAAWKEAQKDFNNRIKEHFLIGTGLRQT